MVAVLVGCLAPRWPALCCSPAGMLTIWRRCKRWCNAWADRGVPVTVFGPSPEYFIAVRLVQSYSVLLGTDLADAFL